MARNDYSSGYEHILSRYPILSTSEEKDLFLLYSSNGSSEIRKKIINSNLRLVLKISLRYYKQCSDMFSFQDIVEYGIMGLIKAVDKFDVSKECKFSTYATNWIKREILFGLSLKDCDIPQTFKFYSDKKLYFKCLDDFLCLNGRAPSNDELSQMSGLSVKEIDFIRNNLEMPVSLDNSLFDDSEISIIDCISDESCSIEENYDMRNLKYIVLDILDSMNISDKAKEMFILRFGLDNNGCRSLKHISKMYGISHQGVQQSNNNILKRIRKSYGHLFDGYVDDNKIKGKSH